MLLIVTPYMDKNVLSNPVVYHITSEQPSHCQLARLLLYWARARASPTERSAVLHHPLAVDYREICCVAPSTGWPPV